MNPTFSLWIHRFTGDFALDIGMEQFIVRISSATEVRRTIRLEGHISYLHKHVPDVRGEWSSWPKAESIALNANRHGLPRS